MAKHNSQDCELIVARFPNQEWNAVFSDAAAIDEILAANQTVGRLQFARLSFAGNGQWIAVEVVSGKKLLGRYEVNPDSQAFLVTGASDTKAAGVVAARKRHFNPFVNISSCRRLRER